MTRTLQISDALALPVDAVTQTIVVYGGKGMGKTNFGGVLVEELYKAHQRFCVIDPMGVWWGLQHGRDRTSPGLEVLLLGGPHGDIPIEPTAGAVIADLVVDETVSVVIDVSRHANLKAWGKAERVKFVTAFCTRLYERQSEKRRPLMLVIDEAARYAPQELRSGDIDAAKCLGIIESLCEEGRNIGIGLTFLTLRSARLNKAVAELASCMVAFRTIGPNSVKAIMDWLGEHVAKERHKQLVEHIRTAPVGTALFVSPGWLEIEKMVPIRQRETFDSSKTPTAGHSLRAPTKARKPDLAKYHERMKETIERAEADDPRALRAKITQLEREKKQLEARAPVAAAAKTEVQRVEVPVLKDNQLTRLESLCNRMLSEADRHGKTMAGFWKTQDELAKGLLEAARAIAAGQLAKPPLPTRPIAQATFDPPAPKVKKPPREPSPAQAGHEGNGEQLHTSARKILMAAYWLKDEVATESKLSFYSGYSSGSSTWDRALGQLRKGLMQGVTITDAGIRLVESWGVEPKPAGAPLREMLRPRLDVAQNKLLDVLMSMWPNKVMSEQLGQAAGYSTGSSTWDRSIGKLRAIQAAEGYDRDGGIKASDVFFVEGQR